MKHDALENIINTGPPYRFKTFSTKDRVWLKDVKIVVFLKLQSTKTFPKVLIIS